MNVLQPYSSRDVTITWGGIVFKGLASDSFFVGTPNNDVANATVGADGTVAPYQHPDWTGTVTINLLQGSPTSMILAGVLLDQKKGTGKFKFDPMLIVDPSGSTYLDAKGAFIMGQPELTRSATNETVEPWVFFVSEYTYIPNPSQIPAFVKSQVDDGVAAALAILNAAR